MKNFVNKESQENLMKDQNSMKILNKIKEYSIFSGQSLNEDIYISRYFFFKFNHI